MNYLSTRKFIAIALSLPQTAVQSKSGLRIFGAENRSTTEVRQHYHEGAAHHQKLSQSFGLVGLQLEREAGPIVGSEIRWVYKRKGCLSCNSTFIRFKSHFAIHSNYSSHQEPLYNAP